MSGHLLWFRVDEDIRNGWAVELPLLLDGRRRGCCLKNTADRIVLVEGIGEPCRGSPTLFLSGFNDKSSIERVTNRRTDFFMAPYIPSIAAAFSTHQSFMHSELESILTTAQ